MRKIRRAEDRSRNAEVVGQFPEARRKMPGVAGEGPGGKTDLAQVVQASKTGGPVLRRRITAEWPGEKLCPRLGQEQNQGSRQPVVFQNHKM